MTTVNQPVRPAVGRKRSRDEEQDEDLRIGGPDRKYVRPTFPTDDGGSVGPWQADSVITSPSALGQSFSQQTKYDSDGQSSMVSEPGSPRDVSMSSDDEDQDEDMGGTFSQSPNDTYPSANHLHSSPWRDRVNNGTRVATPFGASNRTVMRPSMSVRTGVKQHIRSRHAKEISNGSDQIEVPSPIDEDEVATPPSVAAAEAAGSRLSMLSMTDMDMSPVSVDPSRPIKLNDEQESSFVVQPMDAAAGGEVVVRKQRQRSGAQSNGSASPATIDGCGTTRRGFSMGFRPDCEKCRMRVPGHMNHFIL